MARLMIYVFDNADTVLSPIKGLFEGEKVALPDGLADKLLYTSKDENSVPELDDCSGPTVGDQGRADLVPFLWLTNAESV